MGTNNRGVWDTPPHSTRTCLYPSRLPHLYQKFQVRQTPWSKQGLTCLENFEHYFTSVWHKYNFAVVWIFFGIAFLWDWNENWYFPACGHCRVFQICWHIECSTLTASSFRTLKNSAGILSPPLALFVVMLSKAHLTSHSRLSGSRWVANHTSMVIQVIKTFLV